MKKIFIYITFLFTLVSCGANYSLFNSYIDEENSTGGIIRSHKLLSNNNSQSIANQNCQGRGYATAQLRMVSPIGEFHRFEFICTNDRTAASNNAAYVNSTVNEIEVCREYINRPNDNYLKELQEVIISRNIDCNKYSVLLQNKQNNKPGIDWGAVADEIGKINNRNANQSQNNQIGEFCSFSGRRNSGNISLCYYQCSKTGPLQIQVPYGGQCETNFYR